MRFRYRRSLPVLVVAISILGAGILQAETRRALLIGINEYLPAKTPKAREEAAAAKGRGQWTNLAGSLNDIDVMKEILEARFHFKPQDIVILKNEQATREAIIAAIQKHLVDEASAGDVSFFWYSGHGSRVTNSLNQEAKKKDETIVPSDSNTGVWDIRDKELARYFNKALDKGVILTAVFDSCHSGTIARGNPVLNNQRWLPDDPRDVMTPPDPGKKPEERTDLKERGILIFSAAQDNQVANETVDEEPTDQARKPRGAFSLALSRILRAAPEDMPASRIFNQASAQLLAEQYTQLPVMSGSAERRAAPLFGVGTARALGRVHVAALEVQNSQVQIRGGYALGLNPGCELKMEAQSGRPPVRIRIVKVSGLSRSVATVIEGSAHDIKPGASFFEVDKWTYSDVESALRVWWPTASLRIEEINSIRPEIASLRGSDSIIWVNDPTTVSPTWIVRFEGGSWNVSNAATSQAEPLGRVFSAKAVIEKVHGLASRPEKVFVSLPPPVELVQTLEIGTGTRNDAILRTTSAKQANYTLVGRLEGDEVQFAWMMPNVTEDEAKTSMPVRSDWQGVGANAESLRKCSAILTDKAQTLQLVKGWLQLRSKDGRHEFQYHLAFKNAESQQVKTTGPLIGGEGYAAVLVRDKFAPSTETERRRVYIFAIDSWGKASLIYPQYGEVENLLPSREDLETRVDVLVDNGRKLFTIGKPFGFDTYFLLTSREPLGDPSILNFEGAKSRGRRGGENMTPLEKLCQRVGSASRGPIVEAPTDWSIEHLVLKSVPKQ